MVFSSAKPESVVRLVYGKLMRGRHEYYSTLGDEESGQL
jgi:hypothetical protein